MGFLSSIMLLIIASLIVTLFCVAATFTITVLQNYKLIYFGALHLPKGFNNMIEDGEGS